MDHIVTYVKPNTDQKSDWDSLPDDVKNTFDRLGIPEAERSYLAGVGAQYDSELVYHNMQDTASRMGIVYSGIEEALHDPKWEELHPRQVLHDARTAPTDHKFAALHGAVWSGGSLRVRARRAYQARHSRCKVLLPPEREGRRPVRAHAHHRGRGR